MSASSGVFLMYTTSCGSPGSVPTTCTRTYTAFVVVAEVTSRLCAKRWSSASSPWTSTSAISSSPAVSIYKHWQAAAAM